MELSKEYLKENAKRIGTRVFAYIHSCGLTNKIIAKELHYDENTIARKNKNTKGAYYNNDDLKKLEKILGIRADYLAYVDRFETYKQLLDFDKGKLQRNYDKAIEYLRSIGVNMYPGLFWVGTIDEFNNAKEELMPYLSEKALYHYRTNKAYYNNLPWDKSIYLSLKSNPVKDMANIEDLKIKHDPQKNNSVDYLKNGIIDFFRNDKEETYGFIELRFYLSFDDVNCDLITIGVEDANKLFAYMDKSTKDIIKILLECKMIK